MTVAKTPATRKPANTAPRKPQDRKPKAEPVEDDGVVFDVTVDGLNLTVNADDLDDFELMEDIARYEDGNVSRLPMIMSRMFGEDEYGAVKDHLRNPAGKVTRDAVTAFFGKVETELKKLNDAE